MKSFTKVLAAMMLMTAMLSMISVSMMANGEDVQLGVGIVDPREEQGDPHRGPDNCPHVGLDGHTLYLYSVSYDLTLVLLDEEEEVVYTTFIPANTSSVVLPASLSGEYEIQLYPGGDYYFYGWIEL